MGPPTQPQPRTELHEICELIKLDPGTLEQALCSRTVKARDETVLTALSVSQVSGTSPPAPSITPPLWAHAPGAPLGICCKPCSPRPRATTAGTRWPRTSTAASSTGW